MDKNINKEQLQILLNKLSENLGKSSTEIENSIKNGNISQTLDNLSETDTQKIQKILSDKNVASKLLSSPQAQKMIKNLLGDN